MIWIIIFEVVFWVLHYVSTRSIKSDIELWGDDIDYNIVCIPESLLLNALSTGHSDPPGEKGPDGLECLNHEQLNHECFVESNT